MRALTFYQPFASLIICGAKGFETRYHAPPRKMIGERFAIHAAKREPHTTIDFDDVTRREIEYQLKVHGQPVIDDLPLGVVLGAAVVVAAYRCGSRVQGRNGPMFEVLSYLCKNILTDEKPRFLPIDRMGDYSPGRWAWKLEDVKALDQPVPAIGRRGWWQWEPPA